MLLSNLLIRGGLNLVSGKGAGKGNLAGIAESFREPTEAFMKEKATEDQFRRQIGLSAATGVIGERQARELALLKAAMKGDKIALQKLVEYSIEMGEFPDTAEGRKQAFEKYSKEQNIIVDLYGGSGSTLLACEKTNRKCYMMELDPKYIDVIIKRWEQYTGQKAEKIN